MRYCNMKESIKVLENLIDERTLLESDKAFLDRYMQDMETLLNRAAFYISGRTGVGVDCCKNLAGFGGLMFGFYPRTQDQEVPKALSTIDPGGNWEIPA